MGVLEFVDISLSSKADTLDLLGATAEILGVPVATEDQSNFYSESRMTPIAAIESP
jgi:hypothetical protein